MSATVSPETREETTVITIIANYYYYYQSYNYCIGFHKNVYA